MQEIQVPSLGREDPLEKEIATYSSILPWEIPWMEEPGGLQSMGLQTVRQDWKKNRYPRLGMNQIVWNIVYIKKLNRR